MCECPRVGNCCESWVIQQGQKQERGLEGHSMVLREAANGEGTKEKEKHKKWGLRGRNLISDMTCTRS